MQSKKYSVGMTLCDAVIRAVDECIREGILKEFLMKQKDEREIGREEGIQHFVNAGRIASQ